MMSLTTSGPVRRASAIGAEPLGVVQRLWGFTVPSIVGRQEGQVPYKLVEGQRRLAGGMSVEEVCRESQIAESTRARWSNQYDRMKADDAKWTHTLRCHVPVLGHMSNAAKPH
jgi:hypothetical protein